MAQSACRCWNQISGDGKRKRVREKLVAVAPFLCSCPRVATLGIRYSIADYTPQQRKMLVSASQILFPTQRFVKILHAAGKITFPSYFTYSVQKSRLMQEVLFQFLKCPHPLTRIYYGHQKSSIIEGFSFPLKAMGPKMTDNARLVSNECDLNIISKVYNPLIIQEVLNYRERFRLLFVNYECSGVLKRIPEVELGRFGGCEVPSDSCLDQVEVPVCLGGEIVSYLEKFLRSVQIDDIAAEIGITGDGWRLIELSRPPVYWKTAAGPINRFSLISSMIESNLL